MKVRHASSEHSSLRRHQVALNSTCFVLQHVKPIAVPNAVALELLRQELPQSSILIDRNEVEPFETDGLTAIREQPWVVVLAETVAHVRSVLRVCRECEVPLVTRGAGTGLSGGARPNSDGILLVMTKMNKILDVDAANCTATVEPGVTNLAISEAVKEGGLYYAPDPSSQIACSIGGNVAENAGGVHCLKYGLTLHNVIGMKVQTIEGDELVLGGKSYDNASYDYMALFVGSEGMLGVVTEVTVQLLPIPANQQVLLAAFNELERAGECVAGIISAGLVPAGLEMMDKLAIQAAEEYAGVGYPTDAEAILLCELDGCLEEVEQHAASVEDLMRSRGAYDVSIAKEPKDCERLWRGRKAAFPAAGRLAPDYYCMDGTIPRYEIGRVLRSISKMSDRYGLSVANVFHAGDGNLHPLILFDASDKEQMRKAEEFGGEILECCVLAGGTITGEHGVGIEKIDQMCSQFSDVELDQFHRLREAFDQAKLMNPGKAIPTLARCSELGGMHVHRGALPHPELERF